jgi:rhamnosyl/mannosyltransferase
MACGRPVVASRIGGLPWVVEDEVTGLLFEPGDAAGLAGQVARLLDDEALSTRLGEAGRQKFEVEFRWDQVVRRHYARLFGPSVVI